MIDIGGPGTARYLKRWLRAVHVLSLVLVLLAASVLPGLSEPVRAVTSADETPADHSHDVHLPLFIEATDVTAAYAGPRIYVASGDDIAAGKDLNDDQNRYPEKLLADHLIAPGWAVYNQGEEGQTSSGFITGGGLARAYNMRPDLFTIQLGQQNSQIVNLIDSCFDKVKDHEFTEANACAALVLGNTLLWDQLKSDYTRILQTARIMAAQRPHLVIAVIGYPNPYPSAVSATANVPLLCVPLVDTIPTCTIRWAQLPPALVTIDQAFQKLNDTLKESLAPFQAGPNGNRFVFVDIYPKFKDHCMKMDVSIKTTVYHPPNTVHKHDSQQDFGCSDPWFIEGTTGTKIPSYLDPASTGVLLTKFQTTTGMGVQVNADGQKCIADAIWEADTIEPGVTPLKWKLGYGEPANANICQ